ncbi:MAG: hypothetical protein Tsb0014_28600 [Pleurocapsa sp.]
MKEFKQIIYLASAISLLTVESVAAQTVSPIATNSCDNLSQQVSFVKESSKSPNSGIESESTEEQKQTRPSFWWATEQFDPFGGRLVEKWLTDSKLQQIDLVVNWQLWGLLDYLGRYRFVNQFGTVARKYGYDLNIFNQKQQCLASYKYNDQSNPPKWEINFEQWGKDSLQIESLQGTE